MLREIFFLEENSLYPFWINIFTFLLLKKKFHHFSFQYITLALSYLLTGPNSSVRGPLRWRCMFCHLLSRLCHMRVSSDWCEWAIPCLIIWENVNNKINGIYIANIHIYMFVWGDGFYGNRDRIALWIFHQISLTLFFPIKHNQLFSVIFS